MAIKKGTKVKEYRVWRRHPTDQRRTQGHYVLAKSRKEAIASVRRKGELTRNYDAMIWKTGKDYCNLRWTKGAKYFQKTGKKYRRRR